MDFVLDKNRKINLLRSIFETFKNHDVPLRLEAGLLLGYVRDKDFIPWDADFDLGTSEKYLPKIKDISDELSSKGYSVYSSDLNNFIAVWSDGWSIDIPFWRLEGDYAVMPLRYFSNLFGRSLYYLDWLLLTKPTSTWAVDKKNKMKFPFLRNRLCFIFSKLPNSLKIKLALSLRRVAILTNQKRGLVKTPRVYLEKTIPVMFNDVEVLIPEDAEGYVKYNYGDNWKTPIKDFSYHTGDEEWAKDYFGEIWKYQIG